MAGKNRVAGKVVVKEGGVGIADLVVAVYATAAGAASGQVKRLGSTLTDRSGAFVLEYDPAEASIERWNVVLDVSAPDDDGDGETKPLARRTRVGAGRVEQYVIRLTAASLEAAGVPVPVLGNVPATESKSAIPSMARRAAEWRDARGAVRDIARDEVVRSRAETDALDARVESRVLSTLGVVDPADARRMRFVPRGASAEPATWDAVGSGVRNFVNQHAPRRVHVVIPDGELDRFRSGATWRSDVTEEELAPYLYGTLPASRPPVLRREVRRSSPDETFDPTAPDGSGPPGPVPPSNGAPHPAPVEAADVPRLLGRLTAPMMAPEEATGFTQASETSVKAHVQSFQLPPGPADTPATYDFHELQIAFDYVWQQAIDEGVVQAARELARTLADSGADPSAALDRGGAVVDALRRETEHVLRANATVGRVTNDPAAKPRITGPFSLFGHVNIPDGLVSGADQLANPSRPSGPSDLLEELEQALRERYKFEVFAPGSVNFGLLLTYRQHWQPLAYQVGDLVRTITLAPKETRKVTSRRVVKKDRTARELEENLRVRKNELDDVTRSEAEIVDKAQVKTGFNYSSKGSFDIKIAGGDVSTAFTRDAENASQETKKAFRESVMKAAQEFKDERKLEVETKESFEEEASEVGEITNPNDELPVTFLFYELQRRFRISEHIHRLMPVVLVGLEVPSPSRRDIEHVLLKHSWIINRVLLDDRYRGPLEYLCKQIVGAKIALNEQFQTVARLRKLVDDLRLRYADVAQALLEREEALSRAMEARAQKIAGEGTEGVAEKTWEWVVGSGDEEDLEAARLREEAAKQAQEKAVRDERELRMRLDSETAALDGATQAYAKARAEHANRELEVAGLRAHFKENVLYYMQAIWSMTHRDQLFFSLHRTKTPRLRPLRRTYALSPAAEPPPSVIARPGHTVLEALMTVELDPEITPQDDFAMLAEVADLGQLLGFKGNYAIFPLKASNALTDFMMHPYVDRELGLRDPDEEGNFTPEEFVSHARAVYAEARKTASETELAELALRLRDQYARILSEARRSHDEINVPSGSLFIEALPGTHALLEGYKMVHRAADVRRVHAEVRRLELENVRYAARVLGDELDDPDTEKKVVFGAPSVVVGDG
jgi:hypothetical protein